MTTVQAWATVVILAATMGWLGITLTERDERITTIDALRDSVTMLRDSLNHRAEPIYFTDLRLIGFDCRLLLPEDVS